MGIINGKGADTFTSVSPSLLLRKEADELRDRADKLERLATLVQDIGGGAGDVLKDIMQRGLYENRGSLNHFA